MTLVSRISGLVRDIIMANVLGSSALADAFFVAFRIPNFLRRIFAEGAFSQAFVPVFSELSERNTTEAKQFVAASFGLLGVVTLGLSALGVLYADALVTLLAFLLIKEKTSFKGIVGIFVGMFGLLLVVSPALNISSGGVSLLTLVLACTAILALSLGVTYQKMSISSSDIFSSMAVQNLAASVVSCGFMLFLGEQLFVMQWQSFALVVWGVLVLSGCGVFLMVFLLRKTKASQVSTMLLLAPPLAAVESYFLFSESMTTIQMVGFVVTIAGVYLSRTKA
jgi:peptidoglycan biosynthesis protein MviN/MurJ (putative lipid II flippase)